MRALSAQMGPARSHERARGLPELQEPVLEQTAYRARSQQEGPRRSEKGEVSSWVDRHRRNPLEKH